MAAIEYNPIDELYCAFVSFELTEDFSLSINLEDRHTVESQLTAEKILGQIADLIEKHGIDTSPVKMD